MHAWDSLSLNLQVTEHEDPRTQSSACMQASVTTAELRYDHAWVVQHNFQHQLASMGLAQARPNAFMVQHNLACCAACGVVKYMGLFNTSYI